MDERSKLAKSTGSTPGMKAENGDGSAPQRSSGSGKELPVSKTAPTKGGSSSSSSEALPSNLLAKILAVQILLEDFKALKEQASASWQTSKDGKIYWCAVIPGHLLAIEESTGGLLVDGSPASRLIEKLLAEGA